MADEPYVPLLPWVVFAIILAQGHRVVWASAGALVVAGAMLVRRREIDVGIPNFLLRGALFWFGALAIAGAFASSPSSWLQRSAPAAAAIGFAIIAFASLLGTPFTEYWTRLGARQRDWTAPSFRRANLVTTILWGTTFAAIAFSCSVAQVLESSIPAQTVFDWLLPLGLAIFALHRTKVIWEEFVDNAMEERVGRDSLWDVGYISAHDAPPDTGS